MSLSPVENTLLDLLRIDSVITNEREISDYISRCLNKLNTFQKISTGLCQIYHTPKDPQKLTLAFYGHMDTVKNQQDKPPYETKDKIFGCGSSDMKGGLAVMIELLKFAARGLNCPYNLIFVFYDQEEGAYESNGLGPLLREQELLKDCALAFVLEPTDNVIQIGCLGGLHANLVFEGRSAHSARPWEGENAIHKAGELILKLKSFSPHKVTFKGLDYFEVMSATQANTNNSRNSIPGSFTLNLNYRFAPGKGIDEAKQDVRQFVGETCVLDFVDECPSARVPENNAVLEKFKSLHKLKYEPKQAWTDIARLGLFDIPAVNCGPGTPARAHQKNEWISRQKLRQGLEYYRSFLFPQQGSVDKPGINC